MPVKQCPSLIVTVAVMTVCCATASAQRTPEPTNDLPNPNRTIAPCGQQPDGRTWGTLNAVAIDNDGESVWVANRCVANMDIPPADSTYTYNSCAGSSVDPVMKFD